MYSPLPQMDEIPDISLHIAEEACFLKHIKIFINYKRKSVDLGHLQILTVHSFFLSCSSNTLETALSNFCALTEPRKESMKISRSL